MTIQSERQAIISEAASWVGTPYHHAGRVKGAGVDCLTLLACVFENAGMIPPVDIPHYPPDWHMHRSQELYLGGLLEYCAEVEGPPEPADIALWKFGRCYSHGAIVIAWPLILHAYIGHVVGQENVTEARYLSYVGEPVEGCGNPRPLKIFRLKRWM